MQTSRVPSIQDQRFRELRTRQNKLHEMITGKYGLIDWWIDRRSYIGPLRTMRTREPQNAALGRSGLDPEHFSSTDFFFFIPGSN